MLYDDTDQRAGAKFAAADLIGIPWQIMVGPKGLAEGKVEIKRRSDGSRENLSPAEVVREDSRIEIIHRALPCQPFRPQLARIMGLSKDG